MEDLRFIHAADLHLDSPFKGLKELPDMIFKRVQESTFTSFTRIINLAIEKQVDFIIIVGDIYDGDDRSLKAQSRFKEEMKRLAEHGIQAYIVHGNHDHLSGQWIKLTWPDNVYFFGSDVEVKTFSKNDTVSANLYGFSYKQREIFDNLAKNYLKTGETTYHIGLLHGQVQGVEGHDPYAPFSIQQLVEKGFDYWGLGHIHQWLELTPTIIYPGNIQGRHRKEDGEKGCVYVVLNQAGAEREFYSTEDILWRNIELSITSLSSVQELIGCCDEQIESIRHKENGTMVHVRFSGFGELYPFLQDPDAVQELFETLNDGEATTHSFVWLSSYQNDTSPHWDRELLKEEDYIIGDIVRMTNDIRANRNTLISELSINELFDHYKLKKYIEPLSEQEQLDVLNEAEALLVTELLKEEME